MPLSNAQRKAVTALHRKKGRRSTGRFLVEGAKCVEEVLGSNWEVETIYATGEWSPREDVAIEIREVGGGDMRKLSTLDTPPGVLAVVRMPSEMDADVSRGRWLALDGLRDPGNLGTILRLADWFALSGVICSPDCVDWSNSKVVQAAMGSLFRVPVAVRELEEALSGTSWSAGAFLNGESVYDLVWPADGVLVIGNESHGIGPPVKSAVKHRVTIPNFGGAESLNAAMAAAVFCSEWRPRP